MRVEAAAALAVSVRTVANWETGKARIPFSAYQLLRITRNGGLPGFAWRDFYVLGDVLVSPEGKQFAVADLKWWALTCEQAKAWRSERRRLRGCSPPPADHCLDEPNPAACEGRADDRAGEPTDGHDGRQCFIRRPSAVGERGSPEQLPGIGCPSPRQCAADASAASAAGRQGSER